MVFSEYLNACLIVCVWIERDKTLSFCIRKIRQKLIYGMIVPDIACHEYWLRQTNAKAPWIIVRGVHRRYYDYRFEFIKFMLITPTIEDYNNNTDNSYILGQFILVGVIYIIYLTLCTGYDNIYSKFGFSKTNFVDICHIFFPRRQKCFRFIH